MRLTSVGHLALFLVLWCLQATALVDGTDIAVPAHEISLAALDGLHHHQADTDAEHRAPTRTHYHDQCRASRHGAQAQPTKTPVRPHAHQEADAFGRPVPLHWYASSNVLRDNKPRW
ncbi:hypothetical protein EHS25_007749 [Saitozyma podzolica]|jgi:hypothetical protein|uniref:Secreted protein n=1 Tax=Saitozyma podzolica TaxID=1890683 RepID=A0A427YQL9_9TREE|nr:hypothetical protein EHS25_007749 [Saitozyma podzolica]